MIEALQQNMNLPDRELKALLETDCYDTYLFAAADKVRRRVYGNEVYIRGLIEISNYCGNNCYYCGIRRGNEAVRRYRLGKQEILECCREGYRLGFRTFVLQSGEDGGYSDNDICQIVAEIKTEFPGCAVTLSLGEKSRRIYLDYYSAGADRYLLRHESANSQLYNSLHPNEMEISSRKECLYDLKEIGYQVGAGFMVGAPYQTIDNIVEDLRFLQELKPDMIGIGPFLTHSQTPFRDFGNGSLTLTLRLIGIMRLMFPYGLIPATTALDTIAADGRERGLKAGANIVMPNLSPVNVRKLYSLYDNKSCTGEEAAEYVAALKKKVSKAGYTIACARGDVIKQSLTEPSRVGSDPAERR